MAGIIIFMSEPIPNSNPRCRCTQGETDNENAIRLHGPGTLVLSVYLDCPLHGEVTQSIVKSGLKGLSIP